MHASFSDKTNNFDFFGSNLPKNRFRIASSGNYCRKKNQHLRDTMCANFHTKRRTLTFLAQICPKTDLGLEIQKTNVGIRISILEISYVPIFKQIWLQMDFGVDISKIWVQIQDQHLQETMCANFKSKWTTLNFSA